MRRVEVDGEVFYVPSCWTSWQSEHWSFQQRPDGSIWINTLDRPQKWRCVSPSVLPAGRWIA